MTSTQRYEEFRRLLDIKQLMQEAQEKAGLSDFGDLGFVTSLTKLLDCTARDCNFHPAGLAEFKEEVVRDLLNRLRFQDDLKRHPEILQEDVSDPIIILGLPRSGTTKTQRMMGTDANLLKTYSWQFLNPAPFPGWKRGEPDPRIAAASQGEDASSLYKDIEEMQAGHHMAPDQVDEDWTLFEHTFNDWYPLCRMPSWSWHNWVMSRMEPSDLSNYRYVRSLFQYLQWQQGGRKNRRWLMKSCGHLPYMKELTEVFPKATLVHIHRHPRVSAPSLAKLLLEVWPLRVADVDPRQVGEIILDWERISVERYLTARDRLGLDSRIFDVQYDQIRGDPMPVFKEIYRRAGHTLTAEAEQGMRQWEKENEQGKHGKHIYSLEQFGLSEKKIEDVFGEYIRRFIDR